jgi:hypothetical protein
MMPMLRSDGCEDGWGARTVLDFAAFDALELDSSGFAGSPVFDVVDCRVDGPGRGNGDDAVHKRVG